MSNNTTFPSSPHNFSVPACGSLAEERTNDSYIHKASFLCFIIIGILSPVAVAANALILAAIWKKMSQRTCFHVLLSGLAFTDLCTGLIAQPIVAAKHLLFSESDCNKKAQISTVIGAIGEASSTYLIGTTTLIITLMSVERWLHMTRRSLMTSRRGGVVVALILLMPIPVTVIRALEALKRSPALVLHISLLTMALIFLITTSIAYFSVLRIIRHHQQQVRANARYANFNQQAINLAKYKKSVNTILYILGLFYICFGPSAVCLGVFVHVRGNYFQELWIANSFSILLLFLSSSLNPCLYVWRMNDVRNALKQLFCSSG